MHIHGKKIAIVIPWFGRELKSGAELQAWNMATRLAARGLHIEVMTTCCRSHQDDWSQNHHKPGVYTQKEGFSIRRFLVEQRDRPAFDRVCGHLLSSVPNQFKAGCSPLSPDDERIFSTELICSPALLQYIAKEQAQYAAFIFLPYLYPQIIQGIPLVKSKAFLQPCLHDEAYAYLDCIQDAMLQCRGIFWNSAGEMELGLKLYGPGIIDKSVIVGEGVEPLPQVVEDGEVLSLEKLKPFILILGKKDEGKGTFFAVDAFKQYKQNYKSSLTLVVAGPGACNVASPQDQIMDLGLVSENQRAWLLRNMKALIQPSPNESFSRVLFEAWQSGNPAVVRSSCLATATAVRASQGGWLAESKDEFVQYFKHLDESTEADMKKVGAKGEAYGRIVADWVSVIDKYVDTLQPLMNPTKVVVNIRARITAIQSQTVSIRHQNSEIKKFSIKPNSPYMLNCEKVPLFGPEFDLLFFTDTPAGHCAPDLRDLGFRIESLSITDNNTGVGDCALLFPEGWNRSEGERNEDVPRWSTGSARIRIQFLQSKTNRKELHQVLCNLAAGDAISNQALWIRDQLQILGYKSEIYARHMGSGVTGQACYFDNTKSIPAGSALLYHHSIGTEITTSVCRYLGPKAILYHNITPSKYFKPYHPLHEHLCEEGRRQLPSLARYFGHALGVSTYNASELKECGYLAPQVLPLVVAPEKFQHKPDPALMSKLQDGNTNIIFVGRYCGNKRQEDLVCAFAHYLKLDAKASLHLIGSSICDNDPYLATLKELADQLGIGQSINFTGFASNEQLAAYYRTAHLFWSMSEHEGFCVPLIEAMWFDVPVLAYHSSAIPETLDGAGVMFDSKSDFTALARLAYDIVHDVGKRATIISRQRERRKIFHPGQIIKKLNQIAVDLTDANPTKTL